MIITVRQASEGERCDIAFCIAEGFQKDFSFLSKDSDRIAHAICPGLQIEKFYVSEVEGKIVGVMAISDCHGRAAKVDKAALRKHLGILKGTIAGIVLKEEFEGKINTPVTTGYIEFVAVREKYRGNKIATSMLQESIALSEYKDFVLEVTDVNTKAIQCYSRFGFQEFKRIPEKRAKQKGFHERIYMHYSKG